MGSPRLTSNSPSPATTSVPPHFIFVKAARVSRSHLWAHYHTYISLSRRRVEIAQTLGFGTFRSDPPVISTRDSSVKCVNSHQQKVLDHISQL
ncbi:hypothetical protein FH972_019818 [Carpinus fangiana]|uniref:Uncharacterized protein n=1 Tax=Carpinus fangiana TaxID=176857 RepID=A0A5N6RTJ8_9ROSI|nr:hypothetical protein FH972_019818 [Carpinus fangiana]